MQVTSVQARARYATTGALKSGLAQFSDGKQWQFDFLTNGEIFFTIDSGVPCECSYENFGRKISPPKRVAALQRWLDENE